MGGINPTSENPTFALKRWSAWFPDNTEKSVSESWQNGRNLALKQLTPDISFLPQLQRRRLTPLARAAIAVAWDCWNSNDQRPTIFCSTHGETSHCFNILEILADSQDVSPTQFTLSVHSGIAAMFSIFTANNAPYIAMASGNENLSYAMLEAHGLLIEEYREILVVFYDQAIPEVYHSTTPTPSRLTALALLLGRAGSSDDNNILSISHSSNLSINDNGRSLENLIAQICSGNAFIETGSFCWTIDTSN